MYLCLEEPIYDRRMDFAPPLPRSFRPHSPGKRAYTPFSVLLMAYLGPNYPFHGKWGYGHSRAFPGTSFTALINLSWDYPVFGVIPAPMVCLGFGAVRRAYAGEMYL